MKIENDSRSNQPQRLKIIFADQAFSLFLGGNAVLLLPAPLAIPVILTPIVVVQALADLVVPRDILLLVVVD